MQSNLLLLGMNQQLHIYFHRQVKIRIIRENCIVVTKQIFNVLPQVCFKHILQANGGKAIPRFIQIIFKSSNQRNEVNSQMRQIKCFLLVCSITTQESCHSINKKHSYMRIKTKQTFGKRDHDQRSVHEHSVGQMLRHSHRLWLLELHKTHP